MAEQKLTPMLQQYMDIKRAHPDKLLLFRMGDFYETFFDDAVDASKVLGITLTSRDSKSENPVPLAGFPFHALDRYMDKLVRAGRKVVICEQVEDPKQAKGLVRREVVEIITPGAIVDDQYIDGKENNFLAAVYAGTKRKGYGFALIDISTGDFHFTTLKETQLADEIMRRQPVEIASLDDDLLQALHDMRLPHQPVLTHYENAFFDTAEAGQLLMDQLGTSTLEGFGAKEGDPGTTAAGLILSYLASLKKSDLKHIRTLRHYTIEDAMQLDETSRRNLELVKNLRTNTRDASLIGVLDKTRTPMGARLLHHRLLNPLIHRREIDRRLDAVFECKDMIHLTEDIRTLLDTIGDLSRLLGKAGTQRINPREMLTLTSYLSTAPQLVAMLEGFQNDIFTECVEQVGDYSEIIHEIEDALIENPPVQIKDGNLFRDGYHEELDELRQISRDGKGWIARLEQKEREETGIASLKVGFNKVFGYYIEVTKAHQDKVPEHYIAKQTLVNSQRFISPDLKDYESKVLGAEERIQNIEYELFLTIREKVFQCTPHMQQYVGIIAEIDFIANLAWIAYHNNYCRPQFNDDGLVDIKDSRHPVVERLLDGEVFIPNDVALDHKDCLIALITGPNMAGKSTYLRQVGLIAVMAQMGSFVPATSANMPIFDKVFTRVGASDNLAMGQSTFLVEMIETSNILNSATSQSLILLDEIGRGTSTFDGLSLAWSIVEYIHNIKRLKAMTLFATHYHELTELENVLDGVKNFNVSVKEWNDQMVFVRKIERGGSDQSYGIQVARLAGMPEKVIRRAKQILENLEAHELSPQGLTARMRKQLATQTPQRDIFEILYEKSEEKQSILDEIHELELDKMTPFEALQYLIELQKKV